MSDEAVWLAPPIDTLARLADGREGTVVSRRREPAHEVRLAVNGALTGWIGLDALLPPVEAEAAAEAEAGDRRQGEPGEPQGGQGGDGESAEGNGAEDLQV